MNKFSQTVSSIVQGQDSLMGDTYRGSAEALIEAGLATKEQLPGQDETAKMMMSFLPDGTRVAKRRGPGVGVPGYKRIIKLRNGDFLVSIQVDHDEKRQRRAPLRRDESLGTRLRLVSSNNQATAQTRSDVGANQPCARQPDRRAGQLRLVRSSACHGTPMSCGSSPEAVDWEVGRSLAERLMVAIKLAHEAHPNLLELESELRCESGTPTLPQMNVVKPFIEELARNPKAIEGFAAVLTGLLGAVAGGDAPHCVSLSKTLYARWQGRSSSPRVVV